MCVWGTRYMYVNAGFPGMLDSPGVGVTNNRELPWGFWKSNLGLLKEEQMLLTNESSL